MQIAIYHNPQCSKSRQTLEILRDDGYEPEIIEYLTTPPSATQLARILDMLGMEPRELMRKKEKEYAENDLGCDTLSRDALINAMIENPVLIERPIVISGDKAVIGRPPEAIRQII